MDVKWREEGSEHRGVEAGGHQGGEWGEGLERERVRGLDCGGEEEGENEEESGERLMEEC